MNSPCLKCFIQCVNILHIGLFNVLVIQRDSGMLHSHSAKYYLGHEESPLIPRTEVEKAPELVSMVLRQFLISSICRKFCRSHELLTQV